MAGADYNGIEGIFRIAEAGLKPDTFAVEVLTFHAAVEFELEVILRQLLPYPDKLLKGSPKLSFAHKAKLLLALWRKDPNDADKLGKVLKAFQDLRDAVAHKDDIPLRGHKANLIKAYNEIEPECTDDPSMLEIAQGISMFMADDGDTLDMFFGAMDKLGKLVNEDMPAVYKTWNAFLRPVEQGKKD